MDFASTKHVRVLALASVAAVFLPPLLPRAHAQGCAPLPQGLVARWPADGSSRDVHSVIHARLLNGATASAEGIVGLAFGFDGVDDRLEVPDAKVLDPGVSDFTVDFWLRTSSTGIRRTIASKRSVCEHGHRSHWEIRLQPTGQVLVELDQDQFARNYIQITSPGSVNDGAWHHLALVREGRKATLYLDGAPSGSGEAAAPTNISNPSSLFFGGIVCVDNTTMTNPFLGEIDEVEYLRVALGQSEVQEVFAAGSTGRCAPRCGDGVLTIGEECEDGNSVSGDGCSTGCRSERCIPPPTGLVAWWDGDRLSDSFALDLVGGDKPARLAGGASTAAGRVGRAIVLDGAAGYLEVANAAVFNFNNTDSFALEAWIKTDSPGVIFSRTNDPVAPRGYEVSVRNDGSIGLLLSQTWPDRVLDVHSLTGGFDDDEWHHVVVSWDGSSRPTTICSGPDQARIWIDGFEEGIRVVENFVCQGIRTNAVPQIGRRAGLEGSYLHGLLDEVALYSRAFGDAEVLQLFASGGAGKCKSRRTLPVIRYGERVSLDLEAAFGAPPHAWALAGGRLPAGLELTAAGVLRGVPSEAGSFTFTVLVTDSLGEVQELGYDLEVAVSPPPPQVRIRKWGTRPVPGRVLDYYIVIENVGTVPVEGYDAMEALEPWLGFISASPGPARTTEFTFEAEVTGLKEDFVRTVEVYWDVPVLLPGDTHVITYRVKLLDSFPPGKRVRGPVCTDDKEDPCRPEYEECIRLARKGCGAVCTVDDISKVVDPPDTPLEDVLTPDACEECWKGAYIICHHKYELCKETRDEPPPDCDDDDQTARKPTDPNEKGVVARTHVVRDQPLLYVVHFENVAEDVEARDVFVTDVLDEDVDLATIQILRPDGTQVPLAAGGTVRLLERERIRVIETDGEPIEITVIETWDVSLNGVSRVLRWELLNIDLAPGATDAVLFSARPLPGLASGTEIRNTATIQFEIFEEIVTNETLNIIDDLPPTCAVNPLPAEVGTSTFEVTWTASDPVGEVERVQLFVSADGGAFKPLAVGGPNNSGYAFSGEAGRQYGFICVATDTAGNAEVQAPVAEATVRIVEAASGDGDADGAADSADNCPFESNAGQEDLDGDGVGDACDAQTFGNGIVETVDSGPGFLISEACDDGNLVNGDGCSLNGQVEDFDRDGVLDPSDNCPIAPNPGQEDGDGDGTGDVCERVVDGGLQLPSDGNQDGRLDISDAIHLLGVLFLGTAVPPCGDQTLRHATNLELLDANDDDSIDLSDAVSLITFLFLGGPPPARGTECIPIPGCPDACQEG